MDHFTYLLLMDQFSPEMYFTLNAPPMGNNSLVDEELKNIKCNDSYINLNTNKECK